MTLPYTGIDPNRFMIIEDACHQELMEHMIRVGNDAPYQKVLNGKFSIIILKEPIYYTTV